MIRDEWEANYVAIIIDRGTNGSPQRWLKQFDSPQIIIPVEDAVVGSESEEYRWDPGVVAIDLVTKREIIPVKDGQPLASQDQGWTMEIRAARRLTASTASLLTRTLALQRRLSTIDVSVKPNPNIGKAEVAQTVRAGGITSARQENSFRVRLNEEANSDRISCLRTLGASGQSRTFTNEEWLQCPSRR